MADVSGRIFPFCKQFKLRRFDESTLRILGTILTSKNAKLVFELRRSLEEFLRSESLMTIREAAEKPIEQKLLIFDFLVSAFAIIDDVESCLAVRYEAFLMRESKTISHPHFQVSCSEWMNFAEDAFGYGFYNIAAKACENALLCFDTKYDEKRERLLESGGTINEIQRLKDEAIRLSASHSVQAQASEYLKRKNMSQKPTLVFNEAQHPASISFRNGIKQQNSRNFLRLKNLQQGESHGSAVFLGTKDYKAWNHVVCIKCYTERIGLGFYNFDVCKQKNNLVSTMTRGRMKVGLSE